MTSGVCYFCSSCLRYSLGKSDITCNIRSSSAYINLSSARSITASSTLPIFCFPKTGFEDTMCCRWSFQKKCETLVWLIFQKTTTSHDHVFVPALPASAQKFKSLPKLTDIVSMCWVHAQLQNFHQKSSTENACAVLFSPKTTTVQQMCASSPWAKESAREYMSLSYQNEVGQEEKNGVVGLHWRPYRIQPLLRTK